MQLYHHITIHCMAIYLTKVSVRVSYDTKSTEVHSTRKDKDILVNKSHLGISPSLIHLSCMLVQGGRWIMGEIFMTLVIVIMLLIAVCFIGSLVLAKDTKEFYIHFRLLKGFDISGFSMKTITHKKIINSNFVESNSSVGEYYQLR